MKENSFIISIALVALIFTIVFCLVVIPPLIQNPNILEAFAAGFTNPYASGYSTDVFCCWIILLLWIIYESPKIKHGWICALVGIVPGVAVGFAIYLILRINQLKDR